MQVSRTVCRWHYKNAGGKSGHHRTLRFLTGSICEGAVTQKKTTAPFAIYGQACGIFLCQSMQTEQG